MTNLFTKFDGSDATVVVCVFFIVTFLLGFVLNWVSCLRKTSDSKNTPLKPVFAKEISHPPVASTPKNTHKDDLKKIEGIGPKIESLLHAAGILTFKHLHDSDLEIVRKVLEEAGPRFRMHNPSTWSKQAGLAADEKWEELKQYQDYLDGGKDPAVK